MYTLIQYKLVVLHHNQTSVVISYGRYILSFFQNLNFMNYTSERNISIQIVLKMLLNLYIIKNIQVSKIYFVMLLLFTNSTAQ